MKTKGMSSPALSEDDVRRIVREELDKDAKQPATDTEPQASQASSAVPAEAGTPHQDRRVEDRRKRPEPKCYKG